MIRVVFFLLALVAEGAPVPKANEGPETLASWFSSLGDLREGSGAEARVFEALEGWFGDRASVQKADFRGLDEEHSFSRRLWFRVAGSLPGELVVVVPTDGANHRGLAWAVTWAQDVLDRGTALNLIFLFTGAERGAGSSASLGSRTFLQDFYPTTPAAVLYLDADDQNHGVRFVAESGVFPSPLWMVQGLSESFQKQGLTPDLPGSAPALFRLDMPERRNVLAPWFQRSIPALWISAGPANPAVVRALETFAGTLKAGVPGHWDRHYLVFEWGSWKVFWDQSTYLLIFLSVAAILLFGYALLGRRRGSLKVLGPGFWQLPGLLAVLFLAFEAGTSLAMLLSEAQGTPELWKQAPLVLGTFKILVAISLYLVLFLPFRRSPLVRDPDFYGQAALVWLGFLVVGAAAFELSFSFYFLWALVWAAVLVVARWRSVRLLALIMGPLWLFKAAFDVLGPQPDLAMARWVMASPLAGNFILSVLFFPFLLQVAAWHFSRHRNPERQEGLRAGVHLTLWALATLASAFLVLGIPRSPSGPPRWERIDLPSQTRVGFPGARPLPFSSQWWTTSVFRSAFLDRAVWDLRFSGPVDPETVEMVLVGEGPLTVYECSFPLVLDPEGTSARIVVGRQPPLPLALHLTLPAQTRARLEIHVKIGTHPVRDLTDTVELRP